MKFWDNYIKLLIIEGIVALIVLLSVLVLKYGFNKAYTDFKNWYKDNVLSDTDVYEVIE
ncbi:MAG: hypothetical protein IJA44_02330 [Clostridia bacterium]|nr:hypothetical protein [Clostridia bacterium]